MKTSKRLLLGAGAYLAMAIYAGAGAAAGLNVASDPVIFGGLRTAATEDHPVCYDQTTGQLGQCDIYPANIIWVAQSGGDYTDLRDALASITDAATDNRYLIRIAPGAYDLGTTPLLLMPFVDIEGSGMHLTVLHGSVGSQTNTWTGMVLGANDTVLKELMLKNDCNHKLCAAMYNEGVSPSITGVKMKVTNQVGSVTNGVHNALSALPTIKNTIIEVAGKTGASQGIYSWLSEVTILRSKITVDGDGYSNEGVHSHNATSFIEHSTIKASNASNATVVNNNTSAVAWIYASRLSGGPVGTINGAPSPSCVVVTDENNAFYSNTCP